MNFSPTAVRPCAGEAHGLNRSCSFPVLRSQLPIPSSIDDEAITEISIAKRKREKKRETDSKVWVL